MERIGKFRETLEWLRDHPELADGFEFDAYALQDMVETYYTDFFRDKPAMGILGWYIHRNPDCGLLMLEPWLGIPSRRRLVSTEPGERLDHLRKFASGDQMAQHEVHQEYVQLHFGFSEREYGELFMAIGYDFDIEKNDAHEYAHRTLAALDEILTPK
jgi:hypothetical protein